MITVSPDIQASKNRAYFNRIEQNKVTQSVNYNSSERSQGYVKNKISSSKGNQQIIQGWMSKYLNSGNDFSRMYGTGLK